MWDFEHGPAGREFEISYTVPSLCAKALADGSADIGIIPAAAYTQIPSLQVLPDIAIASRRAVRSILLVSQIPIELVRTVALDTSSMTSVALTKILLERWMGGGRSFTPMEPDIEMMLNECDAGLLIGDPALQVDRQKYHTVDLAEEWIRYTGKPFVFAFWAVREAALREADPAIDVAAMFRESRDHGLMPENLEVISSEWGPRVGLSEADVRSYLNDNIYYRLDSGCLEGLRLFYRYAAELGLLPGAPELRFTQTSRALAG
jgi:chorismate dehydratase